MIPTPPTTDLDAMLATADEALEFWSGVPNHRAYWAGASETLRAIFEQSTLGAVPVVKWYAEQQARTLKAEIERLSRENTTLRAKLGTYQRMGRFEPKWKDLYRMIWQWAERQEREWLTKRLCDEHPEIDRLIMVRCLHRMVNSGYFVQKPPRPYHYVINTLKPYKADE